MGQSGAELYAGIDYGHVGGQPSLRQMFSHGFSVVLGSGQQCGEKIGRTSSAES
jgi:hypothetical protein